MPKPKLLFICLGSVQRPKTEKINAGIILYTKSESINQSVSESGRDGGHIRLCNIASTQSFLSIFHYLFDQKLWVYLNFDW